MKNRLFTVPFNGGTLFIGISMLLFILVLSSFFPLFARLETLEEQKHVGSETTTQRATQNERVRIPKVEELPTVIDQCLEIFLKEKVGIRSFNLERFGGESVSEPSTLNYALVRIKLKGSWDGIQRGLAEVETLPNQVIHSQEVKLSAEGGEIFLKIHFQEPDNPLSP
jgi:hypothetical protein